MKRTKHEVARQYLVPEDIGTLGDKGTLTILNEGRIQEGKWGERLVIAVRTDRGIEKEFTLSPTNENALIEKFGEETKKWIDATFSVLVESCGVGKSGLKLTVI